MANTLLKSTTLALILAASALPSFGQSFLTINTDKTEETKRIASSAPAYNTYHTTAQERNYPTGVIQGKATNYAEALMLIQLGREKLSKSMIPRNSSARVYSLITESREYIDNGLRFLKDDILEAVRTGKPKTPGITLLSIITGYERLQASTLAEKEFCDSMERKIAHDKLKEDSKKKVYEKSIQELYEKLKKNCGERSKYLNVELESQKRTIEVLKEYEHQQRLRDEIAGRTKF